MTTKRRWRDWFMENVVWRGQWQLQRPPEHPAERAVRVDGPLPVDITRLDLNEDNDEKRD